jgi:multicomponent Na+:H+ antiporter subunit F
MNAMANVAFAMLAATLVMALIRLIKGPGTANRIVALELVAVTVVGFTLVYAIATDKAAFLDAATVVALIGFLGIVAVARYLERRRRND